MKEIRIVTPVKNSIELTIKSIEAVSRSELSLPHTYTVYNDFSTSENTRKLESAAAHFDFTLVNLADFTIHPSPNYLFVLQREQQVALEADAALCVVESDVIIRPDTIQRLHNVLLTHPDAGLVSAVTMDSKGSINYPHAFAAGHEGQVFSTKENVSFCCALLTPELLRGCNFSQLNPSRTWYDPVICRRSLELGFSNYLCVDTPVLHFPHGSRPWRLLKETNRFKYYWYKIFRKLDKNK
ncbi:MAG: glycosyltransferase family 2 protein [Tannerellaceae bacterium]|jgi:hypothetical protein|nr:glycosyltransferase family 2 protein [Tannerellaceae bacterium]